MEFHAVSCQTFATSIKHGCLSVFTEYNNRHFSASKSSFVILSCMTSLECCKNIVLTKQPLSLCSWHEEHHFTINRLMITPDWVTLRWNVVTATCHSHSRLAQSAHCRWMRVSHDSCRRGCPQSHRRGAGKLCKADCCNARQINPTHVCGILLVSVVSVCCSRTFKNNIHVL